MSLEEIGRILEILSYVVTIVGFPFAIYIFMYQKRRENLQDEYDIYVQLSDDYFRFQELVLKNSDLRLRVDTKTQGLTEEQRERMLTLFDILIALFERAFILVYEEDMSPELKRLWGSWEDYIREWCGREDFVENLPLLLTGEDQEFRDYIQKIVEEVQAKKRS